MTSRYREIDPARVTTKPFGERPTKVSLRGAAKAVRTASILESLPEVLKASDLRALVAATVAARRRGRPVVIGLGGHVIKCGLTPLLVELVECGVATAIAMNGGASIHDCEMALFGRTSEDVVESLQHGMFGMVEETPIFMNGAINEGARKGWGMGESLGQALLDTDSANARRSVLAAAVAIGLPATVHAAVGCETIHMHPSADGAAIGVTSLRDFRILARALQDLGDGGVYLNLGSAVILPEVFVKALNLGRNVSDHPIINFTTANFDMKEHYRPLENVVRRPVVGGGHGYNFVGHHEILLPLFFGAVLEELDGAVTGPAEKG